MINLKKTALLFSLCLSFTLFFTGVSAKIFVENYVASGQVVSISDNIITLADGYVYYPGNADRTLDLVPGQMISIQYYIDANGDRVYTKTVKGKNKLKPNEPPDPARPPGSKI